MLTRKLGTTAVARIGFGCMNLSHAYGPAQPREIAVRVLASAVECGVTHFDTAALYGFGANEQMVGEVFKQLPARVLVASKCGLFGRDGKRVIDGSPDAIRSGVEQSLRNLQTDRIDLLYLHRWDRRVPIEESVGAMADLVRAGKAGALGLSEVSATTLRRAHAVHPITAVQTEYSLWTRNPEIAVLEECRRIGAAFVAFSPLGRGFLTGAIKSSGELADGDIRRGMPRFQEPQFGQNRLLLAPIEQIALELGCSTAQLALTWVLSRGDHVHVIPGSTRANHVIENCGADAIRLDEATIATLDGLLPPGRAEGARYPTATQVEIDTEEIGQSG